MKRALFLLALGAILLVQPGFATHAQQIDYDGVDIVFLVDQSGSMGRLNSTIPPNDSLGLRFYSFPAITSLLGDYRLGVNDQISFRIAIVNFGDRRETWTFSLSGSFWQEIAPNSRDEWRPQYAQLEQDFQRMRDTFSRRDLGNTDFLSAFQEANRLFQQLPDLSGRRLRVIVVLTDGQPYLDTPGFNVNRYMEDLVAYAQSNFPEPDYRIYVIGMVDSSSAYWQRMEPYWNRITNDPCTPRSCSDKRLDRAGLVASNDDVGKRFQEILLALTKELPRPAGVNVADADVKPGPLTVPPYLKSITFAYFKTNPSQRLLITDPQGVIDENRAGVEIDGLDSPIQVVRVSNPLPGRWQIATDPRILDVDITMQYIFARSILESPSPAQVQVQFVPFPIKYTLLDEFGQPLPVYADPLYRLDVKARVRAGDQAWDLTLKEDGRGSYLAEFIPVVTGRHSIEVRAESQDYDGNAIVVFDGEIGAFSVSPIRIVAIDIPGVWHQYVQQPITLQLRDERGTPVQAPDSLQVTVSIGNETLDLSPMPDSTYRALYTPQSAGRQTLHALVTASNPDGTVFSVIDEDIGAIEVLPTILVDLMVLEPTQPEQLDTNLLPWERNPLTLRVRLQDENGNSLDPQGIFSSGVVSGSLSIKGIDRKTGKKLSVPLMFSPTANQGEFVAQTTDLGVGEYTFSITGAPLNEGYMYRAPETTVNVARVPHPWHLPLLIAGIVLAVAATASTVGWGVHQVNLRRHPCRGRLVIADADGVPRFQLQLDRYGRNHIVLSGKEFPAILMIRKMEIRCESDADSSAKRVYVSVWRQGDRAPLASLNRKVLSPGSEVRLGSAPFWLYKDPDTIPERFTA